MIKTNAATDGMQVAYVSNVTLAAWRDSGSVFTILVNMLKTLILVK